MPSLAVAGGGVIHVGWPLKQEKRGHRKSQETGESKASQEAGRNIETRTKIEIRVLYAAAECKTHRKWKQSGNRISQETGKIRKRESYEPHIPDLSTIFVLWFLTFELTPPAYGA